MASTRSKNPKPNAAPLSQPELPRSRSGTQQQVISLPTRQVGRTQSTPVNGRQHSKPTHSQPLAKLASPMSRPRTSSTFWRISGQRKPRPPAACVVALNQSWIGQPFAGIAKGKILLAGVDISTSYSLHGQEFRGSNTMLHWTTGKLAHSWWNLPRLKVWVQEPWNLRF